jgi:predicted dehydrogenase
MDYTRQPFHFKLLKALRYVRLYGPARTLAKIRGQYHKNKTYDRLPALDEARIAEADPQRHVGLLGCGNYAFSVIGYYLKKRRGAVIRGAMDRQLARAASLYERYGLTYYTDDAERVIDDPQIDLVYVASNHASHAEYAIRALERGKCVHIEKPHVVNRDQLVRLCRAMSDSPGRVRLGFNRPHSKIGRRIKQALDSQTGPALFNWFVAGHAIEPGHWYFKEEEGGRVLGNLCHWTDFVYRMVPAEDRYPLRIIPTRARQSDCDIAVTYVFGDGTIGAITFSAKGHTFEGVRESFAAHRGNVLISMSDFKQLTIENVERKQRNFALFRDHGHEASILRSYAMSPAGGGTEPGSDVRYVWETAELFLETRQALERNEPLVVQPYQPSRLNAAATN